MLVVTGVTGWWEMVHIHYAYRIPGTHLTSEIDNPRPLGTHHTQEPHKNHTKSGQRAKKSSRFRPAHTELGRRFILRLRPPRPSRRSSWCRVFPNSLRPPEALGPKPKSVTQAPLHLDGHSVEGWKDRRVASTQGCVDVLGSKERP